MVHKGLFVLLLLSLGVSLWYFDALPFQTTLLKPNAQVVLDESAGVGLNGVPYNHCMLFSSPISYESRKEGNALPVIKDQGPHNVYIADMLFDKVLANPDYLFSVEYRRNIAVGTYTGYYKHNAKVTLDVKGQHFDSGLVVTDYYEEFNSKSIPRAWDRVTAYTRYSGNDNLYIEIDPSNKFSLAKNRKLCYDTYYNCETVNDWQSAVGFGIPKSLDANGNQIYNVNQMYEFESLIPEQAPDLNLKICFNAFDFDGDGIDDIDDVAPNNPNVSTTAQSEQYLKTLEANIAIKEARISTLENKIFDLEGAIGLLNVRLNKAIGDLNTVTSNLNQTTLELDKLQSELKQLNAEVAAGLAELAILNKEGLELQQANNALTVASIEDVKTHLAYIRAMRNNTFESQVQVGKVKSLVNNADWTGQTNIKSSILSALSEIETSNSKTLSALDSSEQLALKLFDTLNEKNALEAEMVAKEQLKTAKIIELGNLVVAELARIEGLEGVSAQYKAELERLQKVSLDLEGVREGLGAKTLSEKVFRALFVVVLVWGILYFLYTKVK